MSQKEVSEQTAKLYVENIGGIDETSAELTPGITLLTGENATNRTSFLKAIMAVMGSDDTTLKADAEEGTVEMVIDGETYTRTLTQRGDQLIIDGDPYLEDPILADLFAFLLETNECRQAVVGDVDLREIIMRPVDTDEIEREIDDLEEERANIDSKLENIESLNQKLPDLEEKKQILEDKIVSKQDKLAQKENELEDLDKDIEETREDKQELESKLDELNSVRSELERTRSKIDSEAESIEALQDERTELETELESLSPVPEDRIADVEQDIQRLRGQIDTLEPIITELQSIIQFNENILNDGYSELISELEGDDTGTDDDITSRLLADGETVTCWTCGSEVDTEEIDTTLDELRSLRKQKAQQRRSIENQIDDLKAEKSDLEQTRERYQHLQRQLDDIEQEIENREEALEKHKARKEELETEIENLEAEVESLQAEDYSAILDVNEAINKLEFELEQHESDLADVEADIDRIEDQLSEREEFETHRSNIEAQLDELRNRVEDLQTEAIEAFNDHMETVLDLLEYDNLERIWIERTHETVREGRQKVEKTRFDLHVVRSTDSGTVYEDTVNHLSESEREVVGLVIALAGYLVHEVYERVPFMLLDSIEALDAGRIAKLIGYLEDYADYLVVALLEEDAAALDGDYPHITAI